MVTVIVLQNMGLGTAAGHRLASERHETKARAEMARAMYAADARRLRRLGIGDGEEQKRTAILGVERMLAAVMAALAESGAVGKDGGTTTSYVVTQTEEERGLTVPTYNADDVSGQKALLVRMYNHRMREHELATLPSMKRIVYWVKKEGSWPHPDRVSLESMRRDKSDSSFTLTKRLIKQKSPRPSK